MKTVILYHPKTNHEKNYRFYWLPYSLLTISAKLTENGYNVKIIDGNVDNNFDSVIIDDDVICVGVSTMIGYQIIDAINFVENVRKQRNIPIIWGGPLASVLPKIVLESGYADYILRGSGDESFYELVRAIENNSPVEKYVGRIVDNEVIQGELLFCDNREKLPKLNYDNIEVEKYIQNDPYISSRVLNYISSQGCPFQCGFCTEVAIYGSKWSGYCGERICDEVKTLCEKYDLNGIKFYDANFFVNKTRVLQFSQFLVESNLKIRWAASAHPNNLKKYTDEDLELLYKSGLSRILIGAESGVQEELDFVKKGIQVEDIEEIAYILNKHNIRGSFTFITGYPTFPEKNVDITLEFAKKLSMKYKKHEFKVHIFLPYPGTSLYDLAIKEGFIEPKSLLEWADLNYYEKCNPWISEEFVEKVHKFNSEFCPYVL